ncbi:hypothetical protein PNIG_b0275 [Pseudoalteromonas nigrifaciens]|uniref:Uncharacterized protein n=1 Tax=Pseudoalteromonas nigrifaciens TaxID=28109 RepID=A0AAC9ULT3_9GAMM|nr:hypothetical protein PNIG_b0275 [Pseudoalteromonas nigrifaciens]SUD23119.1 Uncharacterised protein [Pseudoalteromonas nigrifaciens]
MTEFTLYTAENAPEESKSLMADSVAAFGMVPNLHAVMAEAPTLLKGYQVLHELFQNTSFNAEELTVVWQSINVEHNCHYCVPAHSAIAASMKVDQGAYSGDGEHRFRFYREHLNSTHWVHDIFNLSVHDGQF